MAVAESSMTEPETAVRSIVALPERVRSAMAHVVDCGSNGHGDDEDDEDDEDDDGCGGDNGGGERSARKGRALSSCCRHRLQQLREVLRRGPQRHGAQRVPDACALGRGLVTG